MKNITEFKTYLDSTYGEILLNDIYSANGASVQLFSDNKDVIKITVERLKPHFPSNTNIQNQNGMSLYSLHSKKVEQLINNIFSKDKKYCWKQINHMGGYYFNANFSNNFSITIWPTENHTNFGNKHLSVDELISDYIDGNKHICVIVDDLKGNFLHLYNSMDKCAVLTPLRLIRSLLMRTFLKNNYIYFHAAAVKYKNKGILLTGDSGNGKTSTLLNFLNTQEGSIIANDKVFIGARNGSELEVWGWPTVVNLGIGNLGQYKQLRKFLTNIDDITCTQCGYKPNKEYLNFSQEQMKDLSQQSNKLVISYKQLGNLFDKEITSHVKVDSIINVKLKWDCPNKTIRKLNSEEKSIILNNNIISNQSDQLNWLGYPVLHNNRYNNTIIDKIINSVNFYEYQANFQDCNLTDFLCEIIK